MSQGKSTPITAPRKIEKGTPTKSLAGDKFSKLSSKTVDLLDITLKKHGKISTGVKSPTNKSSAANDKASQPKTESSFKPYPKAVRQDTILELLGPMTNQRGEDVDFEERSNLLYKQQAASHNTTEDAALMQPDDSPETNNQNNSGGINMAGDDPYSANSPFSKECN